MASPLGDANLAEVGNLFSKNRIDNLVGAHRGSQGGLAIALSVSFLFRARREEAKIRRCHLIGQSNSKMPKFWIFAAFF